MLFYTHCTSVAGCTCALFLFYGLGGHRTAGSCVAWVVVVHVQVSAGCGVCQCVVHAWGRGLKQPARIGSRLCSLYALCMSVPNSFVCLQAADLPVWSKVRYIGGVTCLPPVMLVCDLMAGIDRPHVTLPQSVSSDGNSPSVSQPVLRFYFIH